MIAELNANLTAAQADVALKREACSKFKGTHSEGYQEAYKELQDAIEYCEQYPPLIDEAEWELAEIQS